MYRPRLWMPLASYYLLYDTLLHLKRMGHSWQLVAGPQRVKADVAILHVDSTHVEDAYLDLAADYRIAINFGTRDISKRNVSRGLLSKGQAWAGPVIIKSDLNHFGKPEAALNERAASRNRPLPYPDLVQIEKYVTLPSIEDVPDLVWHDENKVVQRFQPEVAEQGFALRTWVFAGSRERCTRIISSDPMVKARGVISHMPVAVPDALRAERARLGFDYGKFDFVIPDREPILLDANRTPGSSAELRRFLRKGARNLAEGLNGLITGPT